MGTGRRARRCTCRSRGRRTRRGGTPAHGSPRTERATSLACGHVHMRFGACQSGLAISLIRSSLRLMIRFDLCSKISHVMLDPISLKWDGLSRLLEIAIARPWLGTPGWRSGPGSGSASSSRRGCRTCAGRRRVHARTHRCSGSEEEEAKDAEYQARVDEGRRTDHDCPSGASRNRVASSGSAADLARVGLTWPGFSILYV